MYNLHWSFANRLAALTKSLPCKTYPILCSELCWRKSRTQYLINQAISNVWKTAHSDGDEPRDIKRRDTSGMYGVILNAPKIIVSPKEGNRSLVLYQINVKSGTLKLYLTTDSNDDSAIVCGPLFFRLPCRLTSIRIIIWLTVNSCFLSTLVSS